MAFIRVFGNTHLNPDCVGKLTVDHSFTEGKRTTTTTAYDATGVHVLLLAETTVIVPPLDSDPDSVQRDNHAHAEIIAALNQRRDARTWVDAHR